MESFNQNMNTESIMKAFAGSKFSEDIGNILEGRNIPFEVIDGIICMELDMSKSYLCDTTKNVISMLLRKNLQENSSKYGVMIGARILRGAPYPIDFLKPEVSGLAPLKMSIGENGMLLGALDLVISLPSGTPKDAFYKKRMVYEEMGVPEYWEVDLDTFYITQFILENGSYSETGTIYTKGIVRHGNRSLFLDLEEMRTEIKDWLSNLL